MQHPDVSGPSQGEQPPSLSPETAYRPPSQLNRDGASMRMVAAMAEPFLPARRSLFEGEAAVARLTPFVGEAGEHDAQYYRRRANEECHAAGEAAVPAARMAHQELADRYSRLARHAMRRGGVVSSRGRAAGLARVLTQRFGLSISGPGALQLPHAARAMQRAGAGSGV